MKEIYLEWDYFYSNSWVYQILNDDLFYFWINQAKWFTENLKNSLIELEVIKFIW